MKKSHLFIAIAALVGAGLTSCGGGPGDGGKTKVTFWHTMGKANQEKLDAMIATFNEKYPNIVIEHAAQGDYTDLEGKLLKAIPAKTTPTMAFCYADHVAGYGNNTLDLTPFVESQESDGAGGIVGLTAEDQADYIAGYWNEGKQYTREGLYSVPFSKSTEVLFYNKTFFDKHSLPVPTKWESDDPNDLTAMWNLCKKIKEIDSSITPLGYDSDDNMYITLSAQYDIPYTSIKNGVGSFDFDNAQAKAMVTKLKGYYDAGYFVTKGTLPNNTYTSTKFKAQELLMSIGSTGGTSYNVPDRDGDGEFLFNAAVAAVPQQKANAESASKIISQGPSICFFKNSKISEEQSRAAWLFYKHITNTENSAAYSILTGYEPVRESSYQTEAYQAHLATPENPKDDTLYKVVARVTQQPEVRGAYFSSPAFKGSSTARQQVGGIISQVLLGSSTIDAAFANAMQECTIAAL